MNIQISDDFAEAGVDIALGVITYTVPAVIDTPKVEKAFYAAVAQAGEIVNKLRPAELEEIATTRRAFKALGKDPSRYRPSSEALYRRIATGKGLWQVNNVVDANNAVSLITKWPVGTYDLERIQSPLVLRLGRQDEPYIGVGRSEINIENLTVLADERGAFGAPFSDSERTKVTDKTRKVMTVLYFFAQPRDVDVVLKTSTDFLVETGCAEDVKTEFIE